MIPGQQAPQQPMPQGAPQQSNAPYPADKKEVEQAKTNAVKMVYSDGVQPLIVEILKGDPKGYIDGLAGITAKILQSLISGVSEKTGRKPKLSMVVNLAKFILMEIQYMAKQAKIDIPQQVLQQAGIKAGDIVEQAFEGGGQPAQQGPPPGLLSMAKPGM